MDIYVVGDIHAGYRENKRYSHKSEISSLELQKTAYKQQIEIMGVGKNNLFIGGD